MNSALIIFLKDLRSEIRTRYAINALLMFLITTLAIIMFAIGYETPSVEVLAGILWIVVFFSAMSGLSRSFVSEEERGTVMILHLIAKPASVYFGKLIFNLVLMLSMNIVTMTLYFLVIPNFIVRSFDVFIITMILGTLGLSSASTIIAAIIARSNTKGTLFPVLSFPILLPLFLTVINATKLAIDGVAIKQALNEFQLLISYTFIVISVSYLLFDYVWKD